MQIWEFLLGGRCINIKLHVCGKSCRFSRSTYRVCQITGRILSSSHDSCNHFKRCLSAAGFDPFDGTKTYRFSRCYLNVDILYTSRQMYHEVSKTLWSSNRFFFHSAVAFKVFFNITSPDNHAQLRSLYLKIDQMTRYGIWLWNDVLSPQATENFRGLRNLRIHISPCIYTLSEIKDMDTFQCGGGNLSATDFLLLASRSLEKVEVMYFPLENTVYDKVPVEKKEKLRKGCKALETEILKEVKRARGA